MSALALFCAATVVFLAVNDLRGSAASDTEVWLGFELYGRAARLTAPLHWAIFAVGAWAFFTRRAWIPFAAAIYVFYVALSHLIWSEASPNGSGWRVGLLQAGAFCLPGIALWLAGRRARRAR
jgi:hypothetical protein